MSESYAALARARSLIAVKRYPEAMDALGPALVDGNTEAEAQCLRAQALIESGRPSDARDAVARALELDPHNEWPHRLRAIYLQHQGMHKLALASATEAVRLAPDEAQALHLLAVCQLNTRKKDEALATAASLVATHPHHPLAHETAGMVAEERGKWADAERHFREALRLSPQDAGVARQLAHALKAQGKRQEAGQVLLAAGQMDPTHAGTRRALGRIGLPALGIGGFWAVKIGGYAFLRTLGSTTPATATAVVWVVFGLLAAVLTYRRFAGVRHLPEHVRRGLHSDHWNFALGWLGAAGVVTIVLALWAFNAPPSGGGSGWLGGGLLLLGAASVVLMYGLWTGPAPNPLPTVLARIRRQPTR